MHIFLLTSKSDFKYKFTRCAVADTQSETLTDLTIYSRCYPNLPVERNLKLKFAFQLKDTPLKI